MQTKPSALPNANMDAGWTSYVDHSKQEVHIIPDNDLMLHEHVDCWCIPRMRVLINPETPDYHEHLHHSLDGREVNE